MVEAVNRGGVNGNTTVMTAEVVKEKNFFWRDSLSKIEN